MNYIGKIISNIGLAYSEINPATLTGAIDVIIVEQADGSYKCSPFHVRFGKMGVIRSKEKIVDIEINGIPVDIHMKLGDSGEAYFLEECDEVIDGGGGGGGEGEEILTAASTSAVDPSSTSLTTQVQSSSPPPSSDSHHQPLNEEASDDIVGSATKDDDDDDAKTGDTSSPNDSIAAVGADAQQPPPPPPPLASEDTNQPSLATAEAADAPSAGSVKVAAVSGSNDTTVAATPTNSSMSKSDSVTSVSVSVSSERSSTGTGSQKRYRRKKKNRASSKPSLPSAEAKAAAAAAAVEQRSSSCVERDGSPSLKRGGENKNSSSKDDPGSCNNHQYTDGELHPFSDSEVGHIVHHIYKKQESVDPYDCKSDSEYEIFKANAVTGAEKAAAAHDHDNISWDWGELPNVSSSSSAAAHHQQQKDSTSAMMHQQANGSASKEMASSKQQPENRSPRSSMLGGVLGFIIKDETASAVNGGLTDSSGSGNDHHLMQNTEEDKGIYLDDLDPNDMNPEVAAKYFPKFSPNPNNNSSSGSGSSSHFLNSHQPAAANRTTSSHTSDEDVESGTGPSLSNSPHSTEYNYPTNHRSMASTSDFASDYLLASNDLSLLSSFDLSTLSKVYHDMSMSLCGGIENLAENPADSTEHFLQAIISFDDFSENPLAILNDPNLVIRMGGKYFTWKMASAIILSLLMFQRPLPEHTLASLKEQCVPKKKPPASAQNSTASSWRNWSIFRSNTSESSATNQATIDESSTASAAGQHENGEARSLNSGSFSEEATVQKQQQQQQNLTQSTPSKTINLNNSLEYTSDEETMNIVLSNKAHGTATTTNTTGTTSSTTASSTSTGTTESSTAASTPGHNRKVKYRKVLRLKSDIVRSLNLKRNCNDVMFSVTTAFQGTTVCRSKIFLWRWDDKLVISDIDGTITRSDVLGHILPYIGKDWAQMGVTQLYSNIEANCYRFLYLSARAIGQAKTTREYLRDLRQDGVALPDGPLLLSPTSLFSALHREVIEKKPEEFKIACLKDIQSLFPENPFFAGFGNKINDNWAYKAVGIDSSRIFTINHKGELRLDRLLSFKSSYTDLSLFVDQMFPPLQQSAYYDGYSSFMFWRPDIPELDEEVLNKEEGGKD